MELLWEQHHIFDNKAYQREDHIKACEVLGIQNPDALKISHMNQSVSFKYWQLVAIAGIANIHQQDYLQGAMLGDTISLGKTWEAISLLLHVSYLTPSKKAFPY